jgi:hypothetical protein
MIQISNDGDGMQELIYGTEGISNDAKDKNFGIPRNPGVPISDVNGVELHFESVCSPFTRFKEFPSHYYPPL